VIWFDGQRTKAQWVFGRGTSLSKLHLQCMMLLPVGLGCYVGFEASSKSTGDFASNVEEKGGQHSSSRSLGTRVRRRCIGECLR